MSAAPAGVAAIQRHTLRLLFGTQVAGGVGTTIGISVGGLLGVSLGGVGVSGLAQSAAVVGAALLAVPVSRLMSVRGRRPGLVLAYLVGAAGAGAVVLAAAHRILALYLVGMLLFGGGAAANLQARYTAVDLAPPARRARQLSVVVWAATVGSVAAPNLAALAGAAVRPAGLPVLAGPFVLSAVVFVLVAAVQWGWLRPDPLLTARAAAAGPAPAVPPAGRSLRTAVAFVLATPAARLGVAAVAIGHVVMVSLMAMTPVHLGELVHGDLLRVVGIVISVHVAGMYAFSPLVGWAADRYGRRTVILAGVGVLLTACAVAGTAGHDTVRLTAGLGLLGLGWSGTMVAGSTLVAEATPVALRASVQGLSDLVMGLAGATGGALSGMVVALAGFPTLALIAALAAVPLLAAALRPVPPAGGPLAPDPV